VNTARLFKAFIVSIATLVATVSHAQFQADFQSDFGADAQPEARFQNANLVVGLNGDDFSDLFYDAGYRPTQDNVQASFVLNPVAQKIFSENAALRAKMPSTTPMVFLPVVQDVNRFILDQEKARGFSTEKTNGISNWALAVRITRLAFCFKTDPLGVAAQVQIESSFDRTKVSPTGAVGFTQMTSVAIDEVNDQLGNRGNSGSPEENLPHWQAATRCYLGGRDFTPMFADGTIAPGKVVSKDAKLRAAAKTWLRSHLDRDLIYGQITLKTLLANAKSRGFTGKAAYEEAFRRYNGEPKGGAAQYARDIFSSLRNRI
jgi:hypothetical protein